MALTQADIDTLARTPVPAQKLLIDGQWRDGQGGVTPDLSPMDGTVLATLSAAGAADVASAAAAARTAFEDGRWSRMAPAGRKAVYRPRLFLFKRKSVFLFTVVLSLAYG